MRPLTDQGAVDIGLDGRDGARTIFQGELRIFNVFGHGTIFCYGKDRHQQYFATGARFDLRNADVLNDAIHQAYWHAHLGSVRAVRIILPKFRDRQSMIPYAKGLTDQLVAIFPNAKGLKAFNAYPYTPPSRPLGPSPDPVFKYRFWTGKYEGIRDSKVRVHEFDPGSSSNS